MVGKRPIAVEDGLDGVNFLEEVGVFRDHISPYYYFMN